MRTVILHASFPYFSMSYVDGFVIPIPKKNLKAYKKMATEGCKTWTKFGALDYRECVLEDAKVPGVMAFHKLAKCKPTETVVFAYIRFKNRKHRDAVNKKVMAFFDKKYAKMKNPPMPFDPKHMAYSGFDVIVEAKK